MAISRDKKNTLVAELIDLFATAKGVVCASYTGLNVAKMQTLRKEARDNKITIKVVKNRLVRVALRNSEKFKDIDSTDLNGQLVYAFSSEDEILPAQILAKFQKTNPELQLLVGFDGGGRFLDKETVKAMSTLPTKDQLRGQLVSVIAGPLSGFLNVANGNQRGLVQVLSKRSELI